MKEAMKILVLLISFSGFSQITSYEQKLYDEASANQSSLYYANIESGINSSNPEVAAFAKSIREKITARTLELYKELLDTLPNTQLRNRINYDLASIHYQKGDVKIAKEYYIRVLNDSQRLFPTDNSLELYSRNLICRFLAEIFIDENDFKNAIKFLDESKKYKSQNITCGNAAVEQQKELERLYAICEAGLKK